MRILAITNEFFPNTKPTSKLVYRILLYISEKYKCKITVVSCAFDSKRIKINDNLENIHIFNYSSIGKIDKRHAIIRFFYKVFRKFYSLLYPRQFFDTRRLYNRAKKEFKNNSFDAIIAFSGYFAEHKAAYELSKKYSTPLYLYYADPFFYNVAFSKIKKTKLLGIEEKWIKKAKCCFLPHNYFEDYLSQYENYKEKLCECELAGFFSDDELKIINNCKIKNNLIVYAGSFFYNWRRPDLLIKIASDLPDYNFLVLGKLDYNKFGYGTIPSNVKIVDRLSGNDYLKAIGSALVLFLEDNSFPEQIPYKTFEYISTGKPILYSSSNLESSTSKLLSKYDLKFHINFNFSNDSVAKWLHKCSLNNSIHFNDKNYKKYKTDFISDIIWSKIKEYE